MFKTALTAATLGLATIATPAIAGPESGQSISVEYRDLNLSTPEGQEQLDRRIDDAARQVCQLDTVRTGTRINSRSSQECFENARKSVETQVARLIRNEQRGG